MSRPRPHMAPTRRSGTALTLVLALALASCQTTHRPPGLSISSDPPGAHVIIDGRDTGFVTPCLIDTADTGAAELRLDLDGYRSARRALNRVGQTRVIFWSDMLASWNTWRFPLFLNYEDFFSPIRHNEIPWPARIFVRLERPSDR